jgi:hypothetical protein
MNLPSPDSFFQGFVGFWIALGIGTGCFLRLSRNAPLKRAVFPWLMTGAAGLFALVLLTRMGPSPVLAFTFPVLGAICLLNLRRTRFCDCGATVIKWNGYSPPQFCTECAAPLSDPGKKEAKDFDSARGVGIAPSWRSWQRAHLPRRGREDRR